MEPRNDPAYRTNPQAAQQMKPRAVRRQAVPRRDADNGASRNRAQFTALTMLGLPQGGLLRLEDARGAQIRVEHGALWITQDGDSADYVVQSGESIRLDRDGVALLTACGSFASTLISVEPRPCVNGTSMIPNPWRWAFHHLTGGGQPAIPA